MKLLQARSRRCCSPAGNADMVIAVDFGTNPDLPLFVMGVVELLRDLFDLPISVGTHNRLQVAAEQAAALTSLKTYQLLTWGTMRFYQSGRPCGRDARSTYCYLLH